MKVTQTIIGVVLRTDGDKSQCSLCKRNHARSFITRDDQGTIYKYGSGCVQKAPVNKLSLLGALSKVTVQTARLQYEVQKSCMQKLLSRNREMKARLEVLA